MFYNFKTSTTGPIKNKKGVNVLISLKNTVGAVTFTTETEMHFFFGKSSHELKVN